MSRYEFILKFFVAAGVTGLIAAILFSPLVTDKSFAGLLVPILSAVFIPTQPKPTETDAGQGEGHAE